jgi:uncharacterized protein (UPF0218 family)
VVDHPPVDLLRHSLIETPVASLHVEDRNLPAFRRIRRKATVGVSKNQEGVRTHLSQQFIGALDNPADCLACTATRSLQEMVWTPNREILEKDLIQLVVIILASVDQQMIYGAIQSWDYT